MQICRPNARLRPRKVYGACGVLCCEYYVRKYAYISLIKLHVEDVNNLCICHNYLLYQCITQKIKHACTGTSHWAQYVVVTLNQRQ